MRLENQKLGDVAGRVSDFYAGKSVFITGATGIVGSVMLEILLRCCPHIESVFILMRGKKNKSAEERMREFKNRRIYESLRQKQPESLEKVQMVEGDVSLPSLGLSSNDLQRIVGDVSIVFHCAANITFNKSLRFILTQNVQGTQNILDVCKQMKKLEVLVYTSTYASNCHLDVMEEKVYPMPFKAKKIIEALNEKDDSILNGLVSEYASRWPNTYAFSKSVAENLLLEHYSGIPYVVIRPTVIGSCWKGTLPGYVEGTPGMTALAAVVAKGFVRVVYIPLDSKFHFTPADVVANTHIVGAWVAVTKRCSPVHVINCVATEKEFYVKLFVEQMLKVVSTHPVPRAVLEPSCTIHENRAVYCIHAIVEHYIPALVIDAMLYLAGKKPKMFSLYRVFDKCCQHLMFFNNHKWVCTNDNFQQLEKILPDDEVEKFYINIDDFELEDYFTTVTSGASEYNWSIDKRSKGERARLIHRRTVFVNFIKTVFVALLVLLCSMAVSQVFRITY